MYTTFQSDTFGIYVANIKTAQQGVRLSTLLISAGLSPVFYSNTCSLADLDSTALVHALLIMGTAGLDHTQVKVSVQLTDDHDDD